jgi:hypothetical protein
MSCHAEARRARHDLAEASAALGGIIVAVIYNRAILIGLGAAGQHIWIAILLLAAVTVGALARRGTTLPNGPAALARDVAGIPIVAYWFAVSSVLRGR